MLKIEVVKGFDGQDCCDVSVVKGGMYKELKTSEPIEQLQKRIELFLLEYFKKKD